MTDWVRWHAGYETDGPLVRRLAAVQQQIGLALDRAAPGPVRLLSLCSGEGRDVLPVLATHPRGSDVVGRLVERDPVLCAAAEAAAPPGVAVVEGDAGTTTACAGAVPADMLLLCGIFGNVSDEDIHATVVAVSWMLAAGGTVIWTRHRDAPDITPRVRAWLVAAGVVETAFVTGDHWSVGAGVRYRRPEAFEPGRRLFTFTH
jgi:hypothetical protein